MILKYVSCFLLAAIMTMGGSAVAQKTIVSADGNLRDKYAKKIGNLMFSVTILKLGRVKNTEVKSDTIRIFNAGTKPMSLSLGKCPAHLSVKLAAASIDPNTEIRMVVVLDAPKKNDYGFGMDRFELNTGDSLVPKKSITVTSTIEETFPSMSETDSSEAPRARWDETSFDYGTIRQGEKVQHDYVLHNDGKKDLVVHKVKSSCTCLKVSISKNTIAPGESAVVKAEFDSAAKSGNDNRTVDVYLNDFRKSNVTLEIKGNILK